MLQLLIAAKADIDAAAKDGGTSTWMAARCDRISALHLLIGARADVNKATEDGATPSFIAAEHGHDAALRQLLDAKADLEEPLCDGSTPCFVAAENGWVAALQILVDARADVDKARSVRTPLMAARLKLHVQAQDVLKAVGARLYPVGWSPDRCMLGHALEQRSQSSHSCDLCSTKGTEYRCGQGCDFDLCESCSQIIVT